MTLSRKATVHASVGMAVRRLGRAGGCPNRQSDVGRVIPAEVNHGFPAQIRSPSPPPHNCQIFHWGPTLAHFRVPQMAALRTARMAVIRAANDGVAAAILRAVPALAEEDGRGTLLTKRVYERVAGSMSAAAARQDAKRLATLAYAVGQLARRAPDAQACIATGLLRDLARVRALAPPPSAGPEVCPDTVLPTGRGPHRWGR